MENLQDRLKELINTGRIVRARYTPYKMNIALDVVKKIGQSFVPDELDSEGNLVESGFTLIGKDEDYYTQLIKYFHGDETFVGDLNKGLLITGPTGTGKSLSMSIMKVYRGIDDIKFLENNMTKALNYDVINGYMVNHSFMTNGFDALNGFVNKNVLYIDDFGLETREVQYYGSKTDAVEYVLSERHRLGKITFATSNLPVSKLNDIYGDRLESRFKEMFNFLILTGTDKRK